MNIVRHGFEGSPGFIEVEARGGEKSLELILVDAAKAFNPLTAAIAERRGDEKHGMGISLILALTDAQEYSRSEEKNRLVLRWIPAEADSRST